MHWLFRIILITVGNAFALWAANRYIPGVIVNTNFLSLLLLAVILAVLNFILKPILDLIFAPVILVTLGLGILVVNALIVWLLPIIAAHIDILHGSITIQSIMGLIGATLIISLVNFIIHYAT